MDEDGRGELAVVTLSQAGTRLARLILAGMGGDFYLHEKAPEEPGARRFVQVAELTKEIFRRYRNLVYILPCGVVVRSMSTLPESKFTDPAVVVLDAGGRHAVSLLSGHEGGANDLAVRVANLTGADPVISTTTDVLRSIVAGIGCRKGAQKEAILAALDAALAQAGANREDVRILATAELKAQEPGLLAAARELGIPLRVFTAAEIENCPGDFTESEFVREKTGMPAVCEPAALLAGRKAKLAIRKLALNGVTVALAREFCA